MSRRRHRSKKTKGEKPVEKVLQNDKEFHKGPFVNPTKSKKPILEKAKPYHREKDDKKEQNFDKNSKPEIKNKPKFIPREYSKEEIKGAKYIVGINIHTIVFITDDYNEAKSICTGTSYNVYDQEGIKVYPTPAVSLTKGYYYIKKDSTDEVKFKKFSNLNDAINNCLPDHNIYDDRGNRVY